jgi:hypothetical protein
MASKGILQVTPITYREAVNALDSSPLRAFKNEFSYPRRFFRRNFSARNPGEMLEFIQNETGGAFRGGWGADYLIVAARHTENPEQRLQLYTEAISRLVEDNGDFYSRYPKLGAIGSDEAAQFCEAIGNFRQALYFRWRAAWFAKETMGEALISDEDKLQMQEIFKDNYRYPEIIRSANRFSKEADPKVVESITSLQKEIRGLFENAEKAGAIEDLAARTKERKKIAEKLSELGFHKVSAGEWGFAADEYYGGEEILNLEGPRTSLLNGEQRHICLGMQLNELRIAQAIAPQEENDSFAGRIRSVEKRISDIKNKLGDAVDYLDALSTTEKLGADPKTKLHNDTLIGILNKFIGTPKNYRREPETITHHVHDSILDHIFP